METSQVTCRTLETFYNINAHTFEKQYKETLRVFSGSVSSSVSESS